MTKLGKIVDLTPKRRGMTKQTKAVQYNFYETDRNKAYEDLGKEGCIEALSEMQLIRNFEQRGEQAYQMGKVWGFYHSYIGQEAIQTAAVHALGRDKNLWVTTYRCHALAMLTGMTAKEGMCELYGKANGNAGGRGGSMHMYTDRMYGGNGIVGGQWPMGAGLAFALKYKQNQDEVAICFGGDGSIMMGTFAESMNLCALWNLPLIVVIENNLYSMGTAQERGVANLPIGENVAKAYGVKSYTVNGMDFASCYALFKEAGEYAKKEQRPVIIEAITYRFKGHSVSDAGLYRTKDEVEKYRKNDPIFALSVDMKERGWITDDRIEEMNKERKDEVMSAMKFADESPDPDVRLLEEGVLIDDDKRAGDQ